MNINVSENEKSLQKRIFTPKPVDKDGLLLKIHHTQLSKSGTNEIRLLYATFNRTGQLLAIADHNKNIFIVDLKHNKCWGFPTDLAASLLKFSSFSDYELAIGTTNGTTFILQVESAKTLVELSGHSDSIINISFAQNSLCLTASKKEGLVWDLKTFSKLQVLSNGSSYLKYVVFIPERSDILSCFKDDTIVVWRYPDFEGTRKISPASWNKDKVKCIAFTRNGTVMVLAGYFSHLAVFLLGDASLYDFIELPKPIQAVKAIEFVPLPFDGGANKMLAILSGKGFLYFYNMEKHIFYNKILEDQEIIRFNISVDGEHIACVLGEGYVNVYKVKLLLKKNESRILPAKDKKQSPRINALKLKHSAEAKKELDEILDIEKLRNILKEYGKYPEEYRSQIWIRLLHLPRNNRAYNSYINIIYNQCFPELDREYPLEDKMSLKNLKRLLSNLVTWSPFLNEVSYLPLFVFPFVKMFQYDPVICFEAVCTVLMNWCQYWFEYFPLPPCNVLTMIGNILIEHDPTFAFYLNSKVTPDISIWPLLETCFSEVLTANDWCILWDHILTNEPDFLLFCPAAYLMICRDTLLILDSKEDFNYFFHNTNLVDVKKLISKAYNLRETISTQNNPKQYLYEFDELGKGEYPRLLEPPKITFMNGMDPRAKITLEKEKEEIKTEVKTLEEIIQSTKQKLENIEQERSTNELLEKFEIDFKNEIQEGKILIQEERKKLEQMRMTLHEEEMKVLDAYKKKIHKENISKKEEALAKLLNELGQFKESEEVELAKAEADLLKIYTTLMKHKIDFENIFNEFEIPLALQHEEHELKNQQEELLSNIGKVHGDADADRTDFYKALCIATSKALIENLIERVQLELASEKMSGSDNTIKQDLLSKVSELETTTKDLEKDVNYLITTMTNSKRKSVSGTTSDENATIIFKTPSTSKTKSGGSLNEIFKANEN